MAKYLISTQEVYRCDTEKQATDLVETAKNDNRFTLTKHSTEKKTIKAKGDDFPEEYYKVVMTKVFNTEKYPEDDSIFVEYERA
jgi:hypothetical protein